MSTEAPAATSDVTAAPAATVTAAAPATTWSNPDGTLNQSYFEKLPEDIRYLKDSFAKYKTETDFFRGIAHQQTMAGQKGLIPLPANAPKEAVEARKALLDGINGVPKEAKDYGIARPQDIPVEAWNQGVADSFAAWCQKNSVNPAAAKELMAVQMKSVTEAIASNKQGESDFYAGEAKTFGELIAKEGIKADRAEELANRGATALGVDLTQERNQILMKNSTFKLAMARHAISVGEDSFVAGETAKGTDGDALSLAMDAASNPANPLYTPLQDSSHPQYKMAKEKIDGWWRQAAAKQNRK